MYQYSKIITSKDIMDVASEIRGDMPNIELPTMGGEVFWDNIFEADGWRVQVNKFTGHARILDDNDVRRAWGTKDAMIAKLKRLKSHSFMQKGDVIGINRVMYEHYAVYIGNDRVIHYDAEGGRVGNKITIHEAPMDEFLKGNRNFFVLNFLKENGEPEKIYKGKALPKLKRWSGSLSEYLNSDEYHLYSAEETVAHARSREGESEYNLVVNNCEHFAIWCKTGVAKSYQVNALLECVIPMSVQMLAETT